MKSKTWEMPETALVYEKSMKEAKAKESKPEISKEAMAIYQDLLEELTLKLKLLKKKEEKDRLKNQIDLLKFMVDKFNLV